MPDPISVDPQAGTVTLPLDRVVAIDAAHHLATLALATGFFAGKRVVAYVDAAP